MPRHLISSDAAIRAIKPTDQRKRLNDGEGLYLLLFVKGGSHGWRLDYSIEGLRKTLSLGTYPDTGLAAARRKASEYRELVAAGIDPSDTRKATKAQRAADAEARTRESEGLPPVNSFEAVAREWVDTMHRAKVSEGHAARTLIRFEKDAFPYIGRTGIAGVSAPTLLDVLRRVESRGAIETAHRLKDACGQVFRFGIATGRCERNPAADLRDALKPVRTQHHAAITNPRGVGELLRAIDGYTGFPATRAALKLAPLVFQRPGNLREMEWAEVDLDAALWTIPAAKMKRRLHEKTNGTPHIVPLSHQAIDILRELQPLTGHHRYVFPSTRGDDRPMSNITMNAALQRMGFDTANEMTSHGFRAMARTMLAERLGVDPAVIEAQLAHAVKDSLGRAYNRTEFAEQRAALMQQWADYLDQLRNGATVIQMKDRAGR